MPESVVVGMASAAFLMLSGVVVLILGSVSKNGRLARNQTIGIRTRHTLASDAAWEAGHAAGARSVMISGVGAVIVSALAVMSGFLPLFGVSEHATNLVITSCILGAAGWMITWCLVAASQANRAARSAL